MLFDIGLWEFVVIGVVALLVFGPDRLPKAAADLGRLLRQLRSGAAAARAELSAAAGMEPGGELHSVVADLRDLDPRRLLNDTVDGVGQEPPPSAPPRKEQAPPRPVGADPDADPDWT